MSTEHHRARADHRARTGSALRSDAGGRRLRVAGTAAALVMSLAACGQQPSGGPTTGPSTGPTSIRPSGPTSGTTGAPGPATSGSTGKPSTSSTASASGTAEAAGSCSALAADLTLEQRVGQLFMAATSSGGMSDAESRRLASLKVGSVLLLGNSTAGRSTIRAVTASIRSRVGSDHGVKVLLAADQEGGMVQRLAGPGFDTIPSAEDQAGLSDDRLRSSAADWGRQLSEAGIDADLAPVSDVVPSSVGTSNQPIGALHRGYGSKPAVVARKNVAFIKGMRSAGIATSVKHFPGLGIVRGNTDVSTDVTDDVTTRNDRRMAGFEAGVQAGADMVMVSSATYSKIDPDGPATYSRTVLDDMIRGDLGFRGVIISDDLLGKALSDVPASDRALRFIRAGGDLAIVGQPAEVEPMVRTVRSAARKDPDLRAAVQRAATRVLIMKARHGLADCSG